LHYWIKKYENKEDHSYDGLIWIYNSYENWQDQFPFWSEKTIRRIIGGLEKSGLLISGNYNRAGFDQTKWYTLAYDLIDKIPGPSAQTGRPSGQNDQTMWSSCPDDEDKMTRPIPEITDSENTNKDNNRKKEGQPSVTPSPSAPSGRTAFSSEFSEPTSPLKEKEEQPKTTAPPPNRRGHPLTTEAERGADCLRGGSCGR